MHTIVDLALGAELRVGGTSVGVFLPEAQLSELAAERDSLRRQLEDLRQELATTRAERDRCVASLMAAMRELVPNDEAKWQAQAAEAERDGVDFCEVVREVEEIVRKKGGEKCHAG